MLNWKGWGRNSLWPTFSIIRAFVWRDWGQQCTPTVNNPDRDLQGA